MPALTIAVTGLVIGECIEFGGYPARYGEIGDISGEKIDDSDGGAVFVVLEWERVRYP